MARQSFAQRKFAEPFAKRKQGAGPGADCPQADFATSVLLKLVVDGAEHHAQNLSQTASI